MGKSHPGPAVQRSWRQRAAGLLAALLLLWGAAPAAGAGGLWGLPSGTVVWYQHDPLRGYRPFAVRVRAGGRTLLLSDSPEAVSSPGVLYAAAVRGPFRVFLYAWDASDRPLYFTIIVRNPGTEPVQLRVSRAGIGGPSSYYFGVAVMAQAHYFRSGNGAPVPTIQLAPGQSAFLLPALTQRAAHPGQLVNAIVDASAPAAPVWVATVAETRPRADLAGLHLLPPDRQSPLMRGTFPNADFDLAVSGHGGRRYLLVGESPGYLHGFSALDHRAVIDYGNYGVLYTLQLWESVRRPTALTLLFQPRSGAYAGIALLADAQGGRSVVLAPDPGGALAPRLQAVVLGHWRLSADSMQLLALQWMPAGAGTLPATFFLASPPPAGGRGDGA